MSKPNAAKLIKDAKLMLKKHSPHILMGLGITGMVTSTVLAVRATPKALLLIEEEKKEQETDHLSKLDTVKTTWKCYIPAAVTATTSIMCLIGASSVHVRRNAALATAYKLSETAFADYKTKVIETVGEKKEKIVREKIAEDQIKKNPVSKNEVFITPKGTTLCYDPLSGRYFQSDIETIKRSINELNKQMIHDMCGYVSVNELYYAIGLKETDTGNDLGWNVEKGLIDIDFSSHVADNGEPAIVLEYLVPPCYGFSHM